MMSCQKDELGLVNESAEIEVRGGDKLVFPDGATNGEGNECDIEFPFLRVLFIGNSYTDNFTTDLPQMFEELVLASGRSLDVVTSRANNGWTLTQHYNSLQTQNIINQGGWDFVILQENAGYLINGNNATWNEFNQAVSNLSSLINVNSPQAQVKLFQLPSPFHHASGTYGNTNAGWNSNFNQIANLYQNVEVSPVYKSFDIAYTSGGTPGLGSNGNDLLRIASASYHFDNAGGFLSAVTFFADIFQDKPCVPESMTFINGPGWVVDNVANMEELLQIGYYTGYGFTLREPSYADCTLYTLGNGPCD